MATLLLFTVVFSAVDASFDIAVTAVLFTMDLLLFAFNVGTAIRTVSRHARDAGRKIFFTGFVVFTVLLDKRCECENII